MILNAINSKIKFLFNDGFFHILGTSFFNKIIAFLTNIALVRILSKNDYGVFTGSFNVFYIVFIFSGLGIISGILYFCSKDIDREEKCKYYRYGFRFGVFSEILLTTCLILYGVFGKVGIEETRVYIVSLAALPFIVFIYDYFSIVLRAERDNVRYSKLMSINSVTYLLLGACGAYLGGIAGTIIGRYVAYIITDVIGWLYCKDYLQAWEGEVLSGNNRKDMTRYSLKVGITSALNVILYRLDVLVIAMIVANSSILASYKIGAAIPENLDFIPQCIMIYYVPVFIRNTQNIEWLKRKTREVYLFLGGISLAIGIFMIIFAPSVIVLLWGSDYLDAVPYMRILSVSFIFISTFKTTSINILLSLKRTNYTMVVSILTGIFNIILDVLLIFKYGSIGAAYATLIVSVLAAIFSFPYVIHVILSEKIKLS